MFLCFFIAELTSTKAAGAFDIALSLLEHCEVPPMPEIFSFKHQKSKGDHLAQYQVMNQDEFKNGYFMMSGALTLHWLSYMVAVKD